MERKRKRRDAQGKRSLVPDEEEGKNTLYRGAFTGGIVSSSQLASQLQALEIKLQDYTSYYFSHAVQSTCNNMVQVIEILKAEVIADPVLTMRTILQRNDIFARAGGDVIEIFPCQFLERCKVKFRRMGHPCTEGIPVTFWKGMDEYQGYLNPRTNIISQDSLPVDCQLVEEIPLAFANKTYIYNAKGGHLNYIKNLPQLQIVQWNVTRAWPMQPTIFKSLVMYNWTELQSHVTLNDLLGGIEHS